MVEHGKHKQLTTREKILFEGMTDWVKLTEIHQHVAWEDPTASLADVQRRTLDLVRSMAEDGVIALGGPIEYGAKFRDWDIPIDEGIARLAAEYVDRFDDHLRWPWMLWFRVTDEGKEIGRSYSGEYALWLKDLRARGREYEPLPLHLVPGGRNVQTGEDTQPRRS